MSDICLGSCSSSLGKQLVSVSGLKLVISTLEHRSLDPKSFMAPYLWFVGKLCCTGVDRGLLVRFVIMASGCLVARCGVKISDQFGGWSELNDSEGMATCPNGVARVSDCGFNSLRGCVEEFERINRPGTCANEAFWTPVIRCGVQISPWRDGWFTGVRSGSWKACERATRASKSWALVARCGVKISAQLGWFLAETNPALDTCSRAGVNRRFPLAVCMFGSQLAVVTFTAPELAMGLFSVKNRRINKKIWSSTFY